MLEVMHHGNTCCFTNHDQSHVQIYYVLHMGIILVVCVVYLGGVTYTYTMCIGVKAASMMRIRTSRA